MFFDLIISIVFEENYILKKLILNKNDIKKKVKNKENLRINDFRREKYLILKSGNFEIEYHLKRNILREKNIEKLKY